MDAFVGEIRAFAFNFNPQQWALCQGQLLSISQYSALFSILGVTYGGNGTTNFALPNIQGTVLNSAGQLAGGQNYTLGEMNGSASVTLNPTQIPSHTHAFNAAEPTAPSSNITVPTAGSYISNSYAKPNPTATGVLGRAYAPVTPAPNGILNPASVGLSGSGLPHDNMMPYLTINYCICLAGIFPARP